LYGYLSSPWKSALTWSPIIDTYFYIHSINVSYLQIFSHSSISHYLSLVLFFSIFQPILPTFQYYSHNSPSFSYSSLNHLSYFVNHIISHRIHEFSIHILLFCCYSIQWYIITPLNDASIQHSRSVNCSISAPNYLITHPFSDEHSPTFDISHLSLLIFSHSPTSLPLPVSTFYPKY
jgi:hypothetical protein